MQGDLKESLMILAGGNITEFKELMKISTEDFIIRYDTYITELESKKEASGK